MKYIIHKEFTFEAAHRLLRNYSGKCSNNHGHSFRVKLSLEGSELDEKDMLIDFKETKALKSWIDNTLDHVTMLWDEDPLVKYLEETGNKVFLTRKNPTSEHLAEIILQKACQLFEDSRIKVHCIEINETCTTGVKIYS
ncbi:MAG: 6-carboxytetrahydropterin synthase [Bacteroidota bacterium]|nr:6-pyruvoyl tetrahydrobiopterin synthase [Odoribacter sp.]MDP3642930.1 6-carboxytetrahydropterin synthase [Bacteroidota bacterium]